MLLFSRDQEIRLGYQFAVDALNFQEADQSPRRGGQDRPSVMAVSPPGLDGKRRNPPLAAVDDSPG